MQHQEYMQKGRYAFCSSPDLAQPRAGVMIVRFLRQLLGPILSWFDKIATDSVILHLNLLMAALGWVGEVAQMHHSGLIAKLSTDHQELSTEMYLGLCCAYLSGNIWRFCTYV